MNRKWVVAIGFIAIVGLLAWANLRKIGADQAAATQGPKSGPLVKVAKVAPRDLTQTVLAPGELEATGMVEIRAPFGTEQVKLLVGPGDTVTAGQVLAELESRDYAAQVASQEAQVARAESALAQLIAQRTLAPLQVTQRVESAKAQLAAAEQGLIQASRQASSAGQRLEQAKAGLLAVQNRAARGGAELEAARLKLQTAEAQYRANPLDEAARRAYDEAHSAYQESLRRATEEASQLAADMAQANQALAAAREELNSADGGDTAEVRQARSQLESARLALDAAIREAEAGSDLDQQIRAAQADLEAARSSLTAAKERLARAQLKATADGTVLSVGLRDGQPAQQGQLLVAIGGLKSMTVTARVDEIDVAKVQPGQPLTVTSNAFPGETFAGKVTRVAAQSSADSSGGSFFEVQGEVQNAESKLRAGMSAQARITTNSRQNVIVVGMESVNEEEGQASVLVVKDFKVEVRPIKVGLRTQTQIEVLEGLQEGEEIVVGPFSLIRTLKDGDGVRVEVTEMARREDE